MRIRALVAAGVVVGVLCGGALGPAFGLSPTGLTRALGIGVGLAFGVVAAALVWGILRWPLPALALVALGVPLAAAIGRALDVASLGAVPVVLCPVVAGALALRRDCRAALRPSLALALVLAYAGVRALGTPATLPARPLVALLARWAVVLAPVALYFAGLMLAEAPAEVAPRVAGDTPARRLARGQSRVVRWLGGAALLGALGEAALAIVEATMGAPGQPVSTALPDAGELAGVLAMGLALALTWDSERVLLHGLIGARRRWARPLIGLGAAGMACALMAGLVFTWSRVALVAVGLAVLWAALLRRRYGGLVALGLIGLPLLAGVARGPRGWLGGLLGPSSGSLLGGAAAPAAQYVALAREAGVAGVALGAALPLVGIVLAARAYGRVRPQSAAAGLLLGGGALASVVLVLGVATAPLDAPATAMPFFLWLGLAQGVAALASGPITGPEDMRASVLRTPPLRVAYVVEGLAGGDRIPALLAHLDALDRARVAPLLISLGDAPLAELARGRQVSVRVVPARAVPEAARVRRWATRGLPSLVRLPGARALTGVDALVARVAIRAGAARQLLGTLAAALDLRPDLLVSLSDGAQLPALLAGRLVGVPVQWQVHALAPDVSRSPLDALVPWTSGVVVPSQAVARGFRLDALAPFVRVVRPGIALPRVPAERATEARRALGLEDAWPLLVCAGPLTAASGHEDLLAAVRILRERFPALRLVCVSEPHARDDGGPLAARLERTARRGGLEGAVRLLGPRADIADIVAAAEVAVVPARRAPTGREALLALALARPLVATRVEALPEVLDEAWGYELAVPGDPAALAEALARVVAHLRDYAAAARRNPGLVAEWFSAEREAQRLSARYERICLPRVRAAGRHARTAMRAAPVAAGWRSALRALGDERAITG